MVLKTIYEIKSYAPELTLEQSKTKIEDLDKLFKLCSIAKITHLLGQSQITKLNTNKQKLSSWKEANEKNFSMMAKGEKLTLGGIISTKLSVFFPSKLTYHKEKKKERLEKKQFYTL